MRTMMRDVIVTLFWMILVTSEFFNDGASAADGLYVSNGTDILFIERPNEANSAGVSAFSDGGARNTFRRIVGLAYDLDSKLLFWSDIETKKIYQATIGATGQLTDVTALVDSDLREVNGLTIDWVANNLYWTDSLKGTIEVFDFVKKSRRQLIMERLSAPRGIYADPINGYLFWGDQGSESIERSRLDGSDRHVIVTNQTWPNQLVVSDRRLYWVNSAKKTLESCALDGSDSRLVSNLSVLTSGQNIFGLAISSGVAYVTNWVNNQLISVGLVEGSSPRVTTKDLGTDLLFSAVYYGKEVQPDGIANGCTTAGCSHLCLPSGELTPLGNHTVRCSCPSFGGLTLDGSVCRAVSGDILLYALAGSGYIGYQPKTATVSEQYLIGRSLRPVGLAYDPTKQVVYWSDVSEKMIHKANLDGTGHAVFLSQLQGLGIVDGMALDYVHRQLYYTNIGAVTIDGVSYRWHKIETIQLDAPYTVRTLVDTDKKPRALALDVEAGHLYYSDWSDRSRIVRINLDGSAPLELRAGLDNPNGLALVGSGAARRLYVAESHYKTRQGGSNYPGARRNGSVYSMKLDGSDWKNVLEGRSVLETPFGLTSDGAGILYVSDWGRQFVTSLGREGQTDVIIPSAEAPMMLLHTPVTAASSSVNPCAASGCGDVCLTSQPGGQSKGVCSCDSYNAQTLAADRKQCTTPESFLAVGDMNGLKVLSLAGPDTSVYTVGRGDPFSVNVVGVAYDEQTNTFYYSDVNSKWIMASTSDGKNATKFFRVDHANAGVIDGMTIHSSGSSKRLYWTDATNGRILYIELHNNETAPTSFSVVVTGLKRPRSIKISAGFIYWTEWGSTARVAKLSIDQSGPSAQPTALPITGLKWPNGIFIDDAASRLYVADGHQDSRKVYSCTLAGTACEELRGLSSTLEHVYDLWVHADIVYYSDWRAGAVIAHSPQYNTSWPLARNLMRPSQIVLKFSSALASADHCASNKGNCSDICVNVLGGRRCVCNPGLVLAQDNPTQCIDPATRTCSLSGLPLTGIRGSIYPPALNYGSQFTPSGEKCVSCQCLPSSSSSSSNSSSNSNDTVYGPLQCQRRGADSCSILTCAGDGKTELLSDHCCPTCVKPCGVKITNCPPGTIVLTLPSDQSYAVHDYLPSVKDCLGQAREITLSKSPATTLYGFRAVGEQQRVTMTASAGGGGDQDKCEYNIIVQDVTPPVIICPADTLLHTTGDQALGIWASPQVQDNAGTHLEPVSKPQWGTQLPVGRTNVSYTVKDRSNQEASCAFLVSVEKQQSAQCAIPDLNNGRLQCSGSSLVECQVECNAGYRNAQPFSSINCTSNRWSQPLEFLRIGTCVRYVRTATGNTTAVGRNVCRPGTQLKFTEDLTRAKIRSNYLWPSNFSLTLAVRSSGCGGKVDTRPGTMLRAVGDKDLAVDIILTGSYAEEDQKDAIKADIDNMLKKIADELRRGFLPFGYADDREVHAAQDVDTTVRPAVDGCPSGTIVTDSGSCGLCPPGTYTDDSSACHPCQVNTYNELEAQSQCLPCPENGRAPMGSFIRHFCKPKTSLCSTDCIMMIVLIVGLLTLLIIVIIVIVVIVNKKRKHQNTYSTTELTNNTHFGNPLYSPNDESIKFCPSADGSLHEEPIDPQPEYSVRAKNEYFEPSAPLTKNAPGPEGKATAYENPVKKRMENDYSDLH